MGEGSKEACRSTCKGSGDRVLGGVTGSSFHENPTKKIKLSTRSEEVVKYRPEAADGL